MLIQGAEKGCRAGKRKRKLEEKSTYNIAALPICLACLLQSAFALSPVVARLNGWGSMARIEERSCSRPEKDLVVVLRVEARIEVRWTAKALWPAVRRTDIFVFGCFGFPGLEKSVL
jgi:hypothetical protein